MRDEYSLKVFAKSMVTFCSILGQKAEPKFAVPNLILYGGADVLAKLISGSSEYAVRGMYLEFKNLADPEDPITPPTFGRSDGKAYYDGLALSADVDYLRISLASLPLLTPTSVDYSNNQVSFFGISSGAVGVHGKTFAPTANSAVYGAALVATPLVNDSTQDVVYARVYSGIDKILKETNREIGVNWVTQFI